MSTISADIVSRRTAKPAAGAASSLQTGFVVFDTESVPDGDLIARVKYPGENLSPEDAIERARAEALELSNDRSDFLPVTFQVPVAVCVLRVATDFSLQNLTCLDAPQFRPAEIVKQFWFGMSHYKEAWLVTFNGRGFDMPLMELAAFDHGCSAKEYFDRSRNRYNGKHLDLMDFLSNTGACRITGGLDMMAKRSAGGRSAGCGKFAREGEQVLKGDQVYDMHKQGRLQEINDYCMFDTLDTYFVFLRTRVMQGELTLEREHQLEGMAKEFVESHRDQYPALNLYLDNWGEWSPWP
jgi:3'-5' exonuclease